MNFDYTKTLALLKGGLLDHEATWKSYLDENPGWLQTAVALTGPLIVLNIVLSLVFSRLLGGYAYYAWHSNFFMALILGLIMAAAGVAIAAFVFSFLAGVFKGNSNFDRAFAAISLAAIPAWVAGPIAALVPYLGFFVALAGGILSLVFLYKIIPLALNVPEDKRVAHFISGLLAVIVINAILGLTMGAGQMGADRGVFTERDSKDRSTFGSGMLGELERQGRLVDAASSDQFEAPEDGELTTSQVKEYIKVMRKTKVIQDEYAEEMQQKVDRLEAKEKAGEAITPADLASMYGGVGTAVSANNAEMEVVKTGDGNWAEHQWIKTQLRSARIQQGEGSDALEHNYELYLEFEDELKGVSFPCSRLRRKAAALDRINYAHDPSGAARFARLTQPGSAGRLRLRGQFFALLRRIAPLFNEKKRKNGPL